jgi:hypothetical protein
MTKKAWNWFITLTDVLKNGFQEWQNMSLSLARYFLTTNDDVQKKPAILDSFSRHLLTTLLRQRRILTFIF